MLDSSHVRFAPEIQWGNSYHYTDIIYVATGWTGWF